MRPHHLVARRSGSRKAACSRDRRKNSTMPRRQPTYPRSERIARTERHGMLPRCDSHRNCVWLTRLTRASNRFDSLARSIRSNLPQCFTAGAMRRIDLACRLTETVAELVSSRFAFKATGPAPQLQLLFWLSHCHARSSDGPFASLYYSVPPRGAVTPARG